MCQWHLEFRPVYEPTPMSFWVHRALDHSVWMHASTFDPPLPRPIGGKGFPVLIILCHGFEFVFASIEEAQHFLAIISQKNMPTSRQLSERYGSEYGPNRHWLSRLSGKVKPWPKRQKLIPCLEKALPAWELLLR